MVHAFGMQMYPSTTCHCVNSVAAALHNPLPKLKRTAGCQHSVLFAATGWYSRSSGSGVPPALHVDQGSFVETGHVPPVHVQTQSPPNHNTTCHLQWVVVYRCKAECCAWLTSDTSRMQNGLRQDGTIHNVNSLDSFKSFDRSQAAHQVCINPHSVPKF